MKEYFKTQLETNTDPLFYMVESDRGISDEGGQLKTIQVKTCTESELGTTLVDELEGYTYVGESQNVPKFTNIK